MATTLRLNNDAQAALDRLLAMTQGLSANELINRMLIAADARTRRESEVRDLFADGEIRWAEVLERLRTA